MTYCGSAGGSFILGLCSATPVVTHSSYAAPCSRSFRHSSRLWPHFIIIIIRQPLCPVVGRRPQHVVSKLPCLVLSSAISCRSSICQVVSPPLGWSPLSSFLVTWSPSGDARGPSVVFEAVDMPCPGPFHFSHSVDYIYEFCPLPDPDVGPSIFVCDVEHTIILLGPNSET